MDIAQLGFAVNSGPLRRGKDDLRKFRGEAVATGSAVDTMSHKTTAGFRRMAVAAAAAVGSLALIGGTIGTIREFEQSMAQVGAITRATDKDLQAMRETARKLGSTTEFTASQAADGLRFLGMAGFEASEAIAAIPAVLDLATASGMELARSADISSNIMSAFGIEAGRAAEVADVLAAASSRANTDVEQLGTAMAYVGPIASALEIDLNKTAAAIGVLSDNGLQGSMAGTGLRRVLSTLANATPEATEALQEMGISLDEVNPATTELTKIIEIFAKKGLTAAQAMKIFGDRGGPAILALVNNNDRLRELTESMSDVTGEANRMAETMRDTLGGDIESLKAAVSDLVLELGDAGLTDVLRSVVQGATEFVRGMTAMIEKSSEFSGVIKVVLASLVASKITAFALAVKAAAGQMIALELALGAANTRAALGAIGLRAYRVALVALTRAAAVARLAMLGLGGPIGLLAAGVTAAVGAIILFRRNADELIDTGYDAAAATDALNEALAKLDGSNTSAAAQNVLDIAAANEELARTALEAAQAEIDKARAIADAAFSRHADAEDPESGLIFSAASEEATRKYQIALKVLEQAEKDLAQAVKQRGDAQSRVNQSGHGDLIEDQANAAERLAGWLDRVADKLDDGGKGASVLRDMMAQALRFAGSLSTVIGNIVAKLPGVSGGLGRLGDIVGNSPAAQGLSNTLAQMGNQLKGSYQAIMRGIEKGTLGDTDEPSGGGGFVGKSAAQQAHEDALREAQSLYAATRTSVENYAAEFTRLNELLDGGYISQETYNRAVEDLNEKFDMGVLLAAGFRSALEELDRQLDAGEITYEQYIGAVDRLTQKYEGVADGARFFDQQMSTLKQGILDAIVTGKDLIGVLQQVAQAIAKAAFEAALFGTGPMAGLFGGTPGVGILSSILPFAKGTDNAPGGLALVGEEGPEIVNLPKGSQVKPADQTKTMLDRLASQSAMPQKTAMNIENVNVGTMNGHGAGVELNLKAVIVSDKRRAIEEMQTPEGQKALMAIVNENS